MNKQNQSTGKGRRKKKVTKNLQVDKGASKSQRLFTSILFLADHESEGEKNRLQREVMGEGSGGMVWQYEYEWATDWIHTYSYNPYYNLLF